MAETLFERAQRLEIWLASDDAYGPSSRTVERMNEMRAILIEICLHLDKSRQHSTDG
jgi:hypothetical protein